MDINPGNIIYAKAIPSQQVSTKGNKFSKGNKWVIWRKTERKWSTSTFERVDNSLLFPKWASTVLLIFHTLCSCLLFSFKLHFVVPTPSNRNRCFFPSWFILLRFSFSTPPLVCILNWRSNNSPLQTAPCPQDGKNGNCWFIRCTNSRIASLSVFPFHFTNHSFAANSLFQQIPIISSGINCNSNSSVNNEEWCWLWIL